MLSVSPQNLILVACFFSWKELTITHWFNLCITQSILKYRYIKYKGIRLRIYTSNLRVNKEITDTSTLSEPQVLHTQKTT